MNDASAPQRFGRYNVVKTLGKGAMGIVYLGEDPVISRRVAIKVIRAHPDLEGTELEERQARFEREFRSAGNLSHPNIVTVYDVGKETNDSFITMEYVQGESLESVLKADRAFTFPEIARIARQIASALDYAHAEGIVHRDIKPANILMTVDGRPKITDFGVAKLQTSGMTSTGMIIGTPMYMSPEQITGRDVSGASDQFSLAAMLYELMTGEPPFQGDNPTTIMYQVVHNEPEPPHTLNKSLPEAVDKAVLRGMAKKIDDRYESCSEMAEAIAGALKNEAVEAKSEPVSTEGEMETVALRADEIVLEDKPAPTREKPPAVKESKKGLGAGLAAVVVLGLVAIGAWSWLGGDTGDEAESPAASPETMSASVEVLSEPAGAQIFVDGQDAGLITPAHVPLAGERGEISELELRRDGSTIARTQIVMGTAMPSRWEPEVLPPPELWTVNTTPAGAALTVNGESAGTTPAEVSFAYDEVYQLAFSLDGYDPVERQVDLSGMDDSEKAGRALDVTLSKVIPPGQLVVRADYSVSVTVDGRRRSGSRISLPPGRYNVAIAAPDVFYFGNQTVEIRSGRPSEISLPEATDVAIAATPGNCRIRINGRDAGVVPLNVRLAVGRHTIDFQWETLGRTMTVTEDVDSSTRRIFRAAPRQ